MRLTWIQPEDLLLHGFVQARSEHVDVSELEEGWVQGGGSLEVPVSGAAAEPAPPDRRRLAAELLAELDVRAPASHFDAADAVARAQVWSVRSRQVSGDRVRGAWSGRAAGCLLGKPVEKIPRRGIEEILRATQRWPLDSWFTAVGLPSEVAARWPWNRRSAPTSLAENIAGMPEDDDLNFSVLALRMLRTHGDGLTTEHVAQTWLDNLPAGRIFTAERVAYRNLLEGVGPERAALVRNPFREWIGALIRADVHGWARPGDLPAAVASVCQDARLSHTGAGVEGAVWAAALAAAALVVDDVDDALAAAASVLEPGGSLAAAVELGTQVGRSADSDAEGLDHLHDTYGAYHWVHVLPNAATIAFALSRGRGDFGRSISLAVSAGWDTDSVGATVGGVLGGVLGYDGIPSQWVEPLHDRLATSLPGPAQLSLAGLAEDTIKVMETLTPSGASR